MKPGEIRNTVEGTQTNDFSGLNFQGCTPSDIDGIGEYGCWMPPTKIKGHTEWRRRCLVLYEFKFHRNPRPLTAQKRSIESLCDNSKVPAVGLICVHANQAPEPIDCANSLVTSIYLKGEWIPQSKPVTAHSVTQRFLVRHGGLTC